MTRASETKQTTHTNDDDNDDIDNIKDKHPSSAQYRENMISCAQRERERERVRERERDMLSICENAYVENKSLLVILY